MGQLLYDYVVIGETANYCILIAQLYYQGKCHGVHMFLLWLLHTFPRMLNYYYLCSGVDLGDIGPKFGANGSDYGYLRLNNLWIPRDHMLMKYSKDGTYIKPASDKLVYGSMVMSRATIVSDVSRALAKACIIAVRHSAVRRQTEVLPGGPEAQILDYQTQQNKLFPLIATACAFHFSGQAVQTSFLKISKEIDDGNIQQMPVAHSIPYRGATTTRRF
ncbi:Peroxisomal acyl-coenzyme A oxidase 1 [Mizuhopecten yessoensis]|uniref:Peroxisomal acyl-coenzyme A oxidase 1 n=1 Tax=Mizuhopecten yessoensis TaxID=6573 RepID=A0A210QKB6_MIZYE|nr:Peroxisomal acyl-coenzyme A oxidase 1 [Mizuhopecten yessoensis]